MPRYDPQTSLGILGDPHRLRITVSPTGNEILVPDDEMHARIVREIQEKCQPIFGTFYSIWTPEFFGGLPPLINYEKTADTEAYAEAEFVRLGHGRYKASIWLPAQLIRTQANARGRPKSRGKIVDGPADALAIQFYHTVRYLAGHLDKVKREDALKEAIKLLHSFAEALTPLTHHRPLQNSLSASTPTSQQKTAEILDKLIRDLCEAAPSLLEELYELPDRRSMGMEWLAEGKADSVTRRTPDLMALPKVRELTKRLEMLVHLRLEAGWMSDNIRTQRRSAFAEDKRKSSNQKQGYFIPSEVRDAIGLTRHPERLPDEAAAVRLAFDFEFDPSIIMPTKAYLRPMFEAAMALGAFEKRRQTERSPLATYGLRAWANNFYGLSHPACVAALQIRDHLPAELIPPERDMPRVLSLEEEMTTSLRNATE